MATLKNGKSLDGVLAALLNRAIRQVNAEIAKVNSGSSAPNTPQQLAGNGNTNVVEMQKQVGTITNILQGIQNNVCKQAVVTPPAPASNGVRAY